MSYLIAGPDGAEGQRGSAGVAQHPEAADADTRRTHEPQSVPRWHGHAAAPGRGAEPRPWAGASRGRWSARRHPRRLRGCRLASASCRRTQPSEGSASQRPGASLALPSPGFSRRARGKRLRMAAGHVRAVEGKRRRLPRPTPACVGAGRSRRRGTPSGLDCAGGNDGPGERLRAMFKRPPPTPSQTSDLSAGRDSEESQPQQRDGEVRRDDSGAGVVLRQALADEQAEQRAAR